MNDVQIQPPAKESLLTHAGDRERSRLSPFSVLLLSLLLWPFQSAVHGQTLSVGSRLDSVSSVGEGGSAFLNLSRQVSSTRTLQLGINSFFLADNRWTYAQAGMVLRREKMSYQGQLGLGPGRRVGEPFVYQSYQVGVTRTLQNRRLFAELNQKYFSLGRDREGILKTGVTYYITPALSSNVAHYFSVFGNGRSRFTTARLDITPYEEGNLFGGFSLGRRSAASLNLSADGRFSTHEVFVGGGVPIRQVRLIVGFSHLRAASMTRRSLFLTWQVSL